MARLWSWLCERRETLAAVGVILAVMTLFACQRAQMYPVPPVRTPVSSTPPALSGQR